MDPELLKDMSRRIKNCDYNSFSLAGQGVEDKGLESIVSILNETPKITFLDLSRNNLSDGVVKYLLKLKYVKVINVENNNIYDEGALELTKKFEVILLTQNCLTENGIKKIIECEEAKFLHLVVEDEIRESGARRWLSEDLRQQLKDKIEFNKFLKEYKENKQHFNFLSKFLSRSNKAVGNTEIDQKQFFINCAIKLCHIYFSPPKNVKKIHISILSSDLLLGILYELGKGTMRDEDIIACSRLIFENFAIRRSLIQENKYLRPSLLDKNFDLAIRASVNQWWSRWTRSGERRQIFQYRSKQTCDENNDLTISFKACTIM